MKKGLLFITSIAIVAALTACGSSTSTTTAVTSTEQTTEAINEETTVAETTAHQKEKKTMNVDELDELLTTVPLTVDSVEYIVQDDRYKSLYPDMLQAFITNHTTSDIKNAVVAFVAWDSNKLPVKIKGQIDFSDGSYVSTVNFNDINLVPNDTFGDNYGYSLDENNTIDSFKAIVKSFETFDGETWKNPYYQAWCKMYEGNKYSDDLTTEVEISDKASFESNTSNDTEKSNNIDADSITAEIEAQPFKVISTNYAIQDTRYKSLYPDMLQAILKNDTDLDIKNAVVAFVAWDSNNLPVKIKGQFDFSDGGYVTEVNYEDINMVPGSTYGEDKGYSLGEDNDIANFKAIVVSYEAFDGTTWKNPCYKDWCKLYEGVKVNQ